MSTKLSMISRLTTLEIIDRLKDISESKTTFKIFGSSPYERIKFVGEVGQDTFKLKSKFISGIILEGTVKAATNYSIIQIKFTRTPLRKIGFMFILLITMSLSLLIFLQYLNSGIGFNPLIIPTFSALSACLLFIFRFTNNVKFLKIILEEELNVTSPNSVSKEN